MFWGGRVQGDGASTLLAPSLIRSLLLSHPTLRLRECLSIRLEAVEQPNTIQGGRQAAGSLTREAGRDFCPACGVALLGRLKCRSLPSTSSFVAGSPAGRGKGFDFWSVGGSR
jgi:hypothetical protein